jgi:hypothetical protein
MIAAEAGLANALQAMPSAAIDINSFCMGHLRMVCNFLRDLA